MPKGPWRPPTAANRPHRLCRATVVTSCACQWAQRGAGCSGSAWQPPSAPSGPQSSEAALLLQDLEVSVGGGKKVLLKKVSGQISSGFYAGASSHGGTPIPRQMLTPRPTQ